MEQEFEPNQTTEEEVIETAETEDVDVVEASNSAETENENGAEFTDETEGESVEKTESETKSETKKEAKTQKSNAEFAKQRREAERREAERRQAEINAEIKKAKIEAVIETLGGINPYTNEKIEDEADVDEYLTMKEIERSGKDPITDYSRFLKQKNKEQNTAEKAKSYNEEEFNKDKSDFANKHPDVKLSDVFADEMFRTFATGKFGKTSLTQIYAEYKAFEKKIEERAKNKAAQILANNAATTGKLSNQKPTQHKAISSMSLAEFEAFDEKVKRGEIKLN